MKCRCLVISRRYAVNSKGEHHHLSCIHCGALKNIFEPLLSERCPEVSAELGFTYVSANLVVFGRCETCSKRRRKS
jgi:Fur family ferric uptake transcriptional regulator